MRMTLTAAALALALSGCANVQTALNNIETAKVPATEIIVAANAFDAAKVTAKNYLVYCSPDPAPTGCNDSLIQTKLIPAIQAGTTARNTAKQFVQNHPGELGDQGVYDAIVAATNTIDTIVANYKG